MSASTDETRQPEQALPEAPLGTTGLDITRLGLGAWAIGGGGAQGGWGPQDDTDSIAAIHRAVELGIGWIDTAPGYGRGRAEMVVGEAVRRLPAQDRPLVFTKCGLVWEDDTKPFDNVLTPASIRSECEASLRRLGVGALDLLQIHWPGEDGTPIEESWQTMADLVTEGKVRFIGVSNFDVELLDRCESVRHVDTFQPQLNLLVRDAGGDTLPWCEAHGTGVIVYSPMRSGLLSGAFDAQRAASLPDDDWRSSDPDFQPPGLDANLALVDAIAPIAERLGASVSELAIAWTLHWTPVTGAIVGARSPAQVDGWVGAAGVSLAPEDLDQIAAAIEATSAGAGPARPPVRSAPAD
ncbi:MAG: Aldo/keto reductase [Ilumatobacteraceae bacterium]|nr:Aldo/keto reductase [Ilumatobacteraceae bacterium]